MREPDLDGLEAGRVGQHAAMDVLGDLERAFVAEPLGAGLHVGAGALGIEARGRFVDVGDELEITFPSTYSLTNFIDLNQDGVLEVVVEIRQWEGFGAIVFQIDNQDVIQTLRAEC